MDYRLYVEKMIIIPRKIWQNLSFMLLWIISENQLITIYLFILEIKFHLNEYIEWHYMHFELN